MKDLEEQLFSTQDELAVLRSLVDKPHLIEQTSTTPPSSISRPWKRVKLESSHDLSAARHNLIQYGYGLVTSRMPESPEPLGSSMFRSLSNLPPLAISNRLVARCKDRFFDSFPVVHWPSLMQWYESAYRAGSIEGLPQSRGAVLYAVLACGTLGDIQQDNIDFGSSAKALLYSASGTLTHNQVIAGFLLALYYWELDETSTAWIALGFAVRVGQDLGLHRENGNTEEDGSGISRCLWWSIYVVDRSDSFVLKFAS